MGFSKEDLNDAGQWNKSFLDLKLKFADISRESLEGIALGIGIYLAVANRMKRNKSERIKALGGYTIEEIEQKYSEALRFYNITKL